MPEPDDMAEFLEPDDVARPVTAADPAWRSGVRNSRFGQTAVLVVTVFAVIIAAWWVIKPKQATDAQTETAAVTQVEVAGAGQAPTVGMKAPTFVATDLAGDQVDLASLQGTPVWLMFVATWCTGCRTEMPDVQEAIAAHATEVALVTVYVGESTTKVQSYSERVGNEFTQVADATQAISAAYGIMGVPSHFFIGPDGVIHATHVGLLSPTMMEESISSLLAA